VTRPQPSLFDGPTDVAENRTGPSHHNAPETSAAAAVANAPRSGTQRARVLIAVARHGGLTDDEIGMVCGLSGNAVRPRRGELVQGGYVEDSGDRRPSAMGNEAVVWTATPRGVTTAIELDREDRNP
jgi:predicted ArsR family transcriptional regulator